MTNVLLVRAGLVAVLIAASGSSVAADRGAKGWKVPRTAHGHPDLQGNWTNATLTPLERDAKFGNRLVMSQEEAQSVENTEAEANERANAQPIRSLGSRTCRTTAVAVSLA
jgi:hypothetical protein